MRKSVLCPQISEGTDEEKQEKKLLGLVKNEAGKVVGFKVALLWKDADAPFLFSAGRVNVITGNSRALKALADKNDHNLKQKATFMANSLAHEVFYHCLQEKYDDPLFGDDWEFGRTNRIPWNDVFNLKEYQRKKIWKALDMK